MFIISISFHCFMHFSVVQLWCTNFFTLFIYKIHTALKRITKVTKQKISKFFFRVLFSATREKSGRKCCKSFTFVARIFFSSFFLLSREILSKYTKQNNKKKFLRFLTDRTEKKWLFLVYNLQKIFFNALFYLFFSSTLLYNILINFFFFFLFFHYFHLFFLNFHAIFVIRLDFVIFFSFFVANFYDSMKN